MPSTIASLAPLRVAGTTVLPVVSVQYDPNVLPEMSQHSGQEFPTLVAVPKVDHGITLEMPFEAAFSAFGFGVTRYTAFELFAATWGSLVKNSGSVHSKWALDTGCSMGVQITGWRVAQDGYLNALVRCDPFSAAGTATPLVKSDNNALPTLAAEPNRHTLGPISLQGAVRPGMLGSDGNLAPQFEKLFADGGVFPIVGARMGAEPTIDIEHADPVALLGLIGDQGAALSSAAILYFRRYDPASGTVVGGATAISITVASGRIIPLPMSLEQRRIGRMGARIYGLSTTSTHPFAVSLAATAPVLP
jgi:hypothetical protein